MFRFLSREHEIAQQVYKVSSFCHGDVIVNDIIIITASRATVAMASTIGEDTGRVPP